ncbi:MAG: DUF4177 domain-containing protein [Thermodesulfobacteriota bacterium]
MKYRVVETSTVTDEELERLINELVCLGWELEDVRFVTKESSRRPAMAFLFFVRPGSLSDDSSEPGRS